MMKHISSKILNYKYLALFLLSIQGFVMRAENLPFELRNKVYNDFVQTVLLYPLGEPLKEPIIRLNEADQLQLSFDILGDEAYVYDYTILHCTYDWKPSDLQNIEYINGYQEDQINNYRFSLNTLTSYVHYDFNFPTDNLKPKLSGNYLLIVYGDRPEADQMLFTCRFMVVESLASISASVPQYSRNPDYVKKKHQIDVTINAPNGYLINPQQSLNLVIRQNGRWDNAVVGLKPSYTYSDKMTYEYEEETVFDGGNQFRNFDLKSFKYNSEYIQRITQENDAFVVQLWPSKRRSQTNYVYDKDINGRKLIKARDDQETDVEGDYAWVYFFLDYPVPLTHEDIYILGALNNWNLDEKSKMNYNFERKGYEGKLFLKQGYYNYQYGILERGKQKADVTTIEGDFWDTQCEYSVYLYFKRPGTVYDQLVATNVITSHPVN